ncbi:LINE-1 reverse transcriptase [Gossypium australe]|uniref:LINE-1 reverse transcriptase n=1 Tax=Gossypium australe TaxID=47621 RepID=A0A5B6VJM3_9ROSI|nr:LINE-1 reverse transcriptase [Gossypium australe]
MNWSMYYTIKKSFVNKRQGAIFDPKTNELEATNFYQNLYGKDPGPMRNLPPSRFPQLDSCDIDFLGKFVTDNEIKTALFNIVPLKASSSDGFHALFFQKQLGTVGTVVCE